MDFKYFKDHANAQYKKMSDEAQKYTDSLKSGKYQHTNVSIEMFVNAPVIVVPEDIYSECSNYIKFDLGQMIVSSELQKYDEEKPENFYNLRETDEGLYDKYIIQLDRMHLEFTHYGKDRVNPLEQPIHHSIIENISYNVSIENCLGPLNKIYPTLRVNVDFDDIGIDVDLNNMPMVLRLKNRILLELENAEILKLEEKVKKKF